ncbi:MAG: hypothetical protein LBL52_02230 [Rickettsiales bacterium]|jgi:hypothetical protein|nr:hypothetical protein [Rickettsiales bacterium]
MNIIEKDQASELRRMCANRERASVGVSPFARIRNFIMRERKSVRQINEFFNDFLIPQIKQDRLKK